MSVNQMLLPEAIRSLVANKQREGFFGEISITLVRGEIQSVSISARRRLEDLVSDELMKGKRYIIKANRSDAPVENDNQKNAISTEVVTETTDVIRDALAQNAIE